MKGATTSKDVTISMSEINSSETNKRICIICGCHTSQTINIRESCNGPNLVRLIEERFKFQPLDDDKYLCCSCNNWHSLQALRNSNGTERPSGTCRLSQNDIESVRSSPNIVDHMKTCTKPIAHVQPRLKDPAQSKSPQLPKTDCHSATKIKHFYSKRTSLTWYRMKRNRRKSLHVCSTCGRTVLRRTNAVRSTTTIECKRCHEISLLHKMYLKTVLLQEEERFSQDKPPKLVNETSPMPYQHRRYQRPLVDGKVVSMLRRVGTTLSRDPTCTSKPPIMSPQKKKSKRWTRDIDDDEILINFNSVITEVLPIRHIQRRRRLSYHDHASEHNTTEAIELSSSDEEDDDNVQQQQEISLENVYSLLPKGLTVSLIPTSEPLLSN